MIRDYIIPALLILSLGLLITVLIAWVSMSCGDKKVEGTWIVEMDCGQYVTSTNDFESWVLKNLDKEIVSVTYRYNVCNSNRVYYIVFRGPSPFPKGLGDSKTGE